MKAGSAPSVRLGCVKYLNAQPLIHGWSGSVVFDHPAALCRQLADGELDVAFVSSFEFLRDPVYTIVDRVCVAADGPVHSVFVAHHGQVEDLEEISLDPASRTSVNLLRVLLAELDLRPRLFEAASDSQSARLLIGDQALRFRAGHGDEFEYWDLAAEWKRLTSFPFVFALWLIRPETPNAEALAEKLRARRDANLQALDQVVAAQTGFSAEFCDFYFRECLTFDFAKAEKAALLHFRSLCEKHGLLDSNAAILRLV
ncbi:MAG: menaquinone biosynthesis protein [Chthoniobacterales bacterium]